MLKISRKCLKLLSKTLQFMTSLNNKCGGWFVECGRLFVVHCVCPFMCMLYVGYWLFIVNLKTVCTKLTHKFLFILM